MCGVNVGGLLCGTSIESRESIRSIESIESVKSSYSTESIESIVRLYTAYRAYRICRIVRIKYFIAPKNIQKRNRFFHKTFFTTGPQKTNILGLE